MMAVYDFAAAAFPWIAMGLALAVVLAVMASREKSGNHAQNYGPVGMCLGAGVGVAWGSMLGDLGMGAAVGMLLGLAVGSLYDKPLDEGNQDTGDKD